MTKKTTTLLPEENLNLPRAGIFHAKEVNDNFVLWRIGESKRAPELGADELAQRIAFHCFLCGTQLTSKRGAKTKDTKEDVFPQWMQRHFKLADKLIELEDHSTRRYDEVVIPCCARCNNVYLSRFEDRLVKAFREGFDRFSRLRKSDIFLWCAKIYYGLVHLEVEPRHPITKEPMKPTLPRESLEDLNFLLRFLQGFRKRVVFAGFDYLPFSLLLFPLQSGRDSTQFFEVKQVTIFPGIALQLGSIGIISVFDDFGEMELYYADQFRHVLYGRTLHPQQFWELAGRLFYRASLVPLETSMSVIEGEEHMTLIVHPRPAEDGLPKADPWSAAQFVSQVTSAPPECFCNPETKVTRTSLMRPDGSFNELSLVEEETPSV